MKTTDSDGKASELVNGLPSDPRYLLVERVASSSARSEEHTSELQSQFHLVCRLLLEKKKKKKRPTGRTKRDRTKQRYGSQNTNHCGRNKANTVAMTTLGKAPRTSRCTKTADTRTSNQ